MAVINQTLAPGVGTDVNCTFDRTNHNGNVEIYFIFMKINTTY